MFQFQPFFRLVSVLVIAALFSGCGYTFEGAGSILPADIKHVYIPLAQNETAEPGLDQKLTEAMRDRFERYGVVFVVDDIQDADATLRMKILDLERTTRTVTSRTDTALQLDTTLKVAAELRRTTGQVLWRDKNIAVSKAFGSASQSVVTSSADFASGSLSGSDLNALGDREVERGQESQALDILSEEVAKQVYTQAVMPDF